jgi:hypothetical protein
VARHSIQTEFPARIGFEHDSHMNLIVEVALDRLDHGQLVLQNQVEDIGATLWAT